MSEIIRTHGLKKEYKNEIAVKHLDFCTSIWRDMCIYRQKMGQENLLFSKCFQDKFNRQLENYNYLA